MRLSLGSIGLALAVALAAAGGLLALRPARAGSPGPTGVWQGKVAFRDSSLVEGDKGNKGAFDCSLEVGTVAGGQVEATLTVQSDEGTQQFPLGGGSGNGNLWLGNGDQVSPMLLAGSISGSGAKLKMKLTGVFVEDTDVNTLVVSLKLTGPLKK